MNFHNFRWLFTNSVHISVHTINNNPEVSKKQLANALALSKTAIDNNIDHLRQLNILERIGPDKGGKWKIHFIQPKD